MTSKTITTLRILPAVAAALALGACSTGGQLDQVRAKVLNNFQSTELKISPELTRQATIENAVVYSPGTALAVAFDITMPKSCSFLMISGSFLDKDGTKIAFIEGSVRGYDKNQKAHVEMNASKVAPLFRFDSSVAVATVDKMSCQA